MCIRLKHLVSFIAFFTAVLCCGQSNKGIWLTDVASKALDSKQGIAEVVNRCKAIGLENIYVVVWNRGYTLYPSKVMKTQFGKEVSPRFADFDVLETLIETAHQQNLKVHAWFEFGFSSSYQEHDGGHILRTKPEWKALDANGNLVSKNGFQWMNAFHPEVQGFLLSLIQEVLLNYAIDGIQGDDRLPANPSTAGYDNFTISLYKKEHQGNTPPSDYRNAAWVDWRAQKLNQFAKKVFNKVKSLKPDVLVTMAPSIYPWSKEEYLQDWPAWVKNGWVDQIIPQVYRYDIDAYTNTLKSNLAFMPKDVDIQFVPGVLLKVDDYLPSLDYLKQMIQANRELGLDGEVFFFYEGLKGHEDFFIKTYQKM